MKPQCGQCKFWDRLQPNRTDGYCHARAPVAVPTLEFRLATPSGMESMLPLGEVFCLRPSYDRVSSWPITGAGDWCGDFRPEGT